MKFRKYCFLAFIVVSKTATATESTLIIPPVIVKANKKITRSLTSGPSLMVTKQELRATGANNLSQALQNLAGIQLRDTTGNGSQIAMSMRGFGSNATSNVLVVINGIPITNPDLAPPDLNVISLPNIEYIEVVGGSESVLYGDQAVAGIINIVTNQSTKEKIDAACSTGSYHYYYCYAALSKRFGRIQYSLIASSKKTDNYRDHNNYDQNLFSGNVDFIYATGRYRFNYNLNNEDMQYPGALTAAQVRQNRRQASNHTDFFTDWSGFFLFQHHQFLNSTWQLKTNLSRREMHGHGVLTTPFNQSRQTYYFNPQLQGHIRATKVIGGLDAQTDYYHLSSLFGLTNNHQQKYSLFTTANIPFTARATLSIGARAAQQNSQLQSVMTNDMINRAMATNLGVNVQVNSSVDLYLRRAESFRFPKADENASAPIGVTKLRTQRGIAYEAGLHWLKNTFQGRASFYLLNLRDEIAFDPTQTPQQPFGANRNLAATERRGCSLSYKGIITSKLSMGAQYNYVNARFREGIREGNRIPLVSEMIFLANMNYRVLDNLYFYGELVYTGNQFPANDDANLSGKIGGYTVLNINLRYQFKNLEASMRINNLLDKNYFYYTAFQTSTFKDTFYPAPGVNFLLTVKYSFL